MVALRYEIKYIINLSSKKHLVLKEEIVSNVNINEEDVDIIKHILYTLQLHHNTKKIKIIEVTKLLLDYDRTE